MEDYKAFYQGKKILVTGGAGAIGSNLVKALTSLGAFVIVLDNLSAGYTWNLPKEEKNMLFVRGDVTNDVDLKRVFNERPRIIFRLAAFFANQQSVDYPEKDLLNSGLGNVKMLEYSVLSGSVEKFIYASSGCAIYGSNAPMPLKEEFISLHLSTPYQISKMTGELYCNFFYHQYGLKVIKPRFFNSYGPGEVPGQYRNVIPNFIFWAMNGKSLPITGTGEETRDFTYVGDIVDALLRAGFYEQAIGEEFNVATGKEISIINLAHMVNALTGNKSGIKFLPRRKWDTKPHLLASIEKATKIIGYKPQMEFKTGLENTVKWFKDNWDYIVKSADFGPGISSAVREKM